MGFTELPSRAEQVGEVVHRAGVPLRRRSAPQALCLGKIAIVGESPATAEQCFGVTVGAYERVDHRHDRGVITGCRLEVGWGEKAQFTGDVDISSMRAGVATAGQDVIDP
ncbi:hypothetical protein OH799_06605 [Nocardia sp. NBC_00881]|uniref:hypothetical protein n=1 Tax=Nocardia sp. NBC_00881 TaxID=2975995 RepID=UPI003862F069|nr:hypothetical protein OH799_06605 [Nocardia sp. NBC_00881]